VTTGDSLIRLIGCLIRFTGKFSKTQIHLFYGIMKHS